MSHIEWTDEQLIEYRIDRAELEILIQQLESVAKKLEKLQLNIYAQGYTACIISNKRPTHTENGVPDTGSVIAAIPMSIDGGDW